MGISQRKISYAIGAAAWDSKSAQEGLPVIEHFEPEPVFDQSFSPMAAKAEPMPSGEDVRIGPVYYVCDVPVCFSPAHAILFLDKFFEGASIGGSPNYDRYYTAEDIQSEPDSPYINLWKKTSKEGHDHNLCLYNALVTGITITKEQGKTLRMSARCAFGARSMDESDPGNWAIDWANGNTDSLVDGQISSYIGDPDGTGTSEYKFTRFNIILSSDFNPHFFSSQNPDRFTRGKIHLAGELELRDIVDQVETFNNWMETSTSRKISIVLGSLAGLGIHCKLHAGGGAEDDVTRRGKYNLTGTYETDATYPTGYRFWVRAGRPYTP